MAKMDKNDAAKAAEAVAGSDAAMIDATIDEVYTHVFSRPVKYDGEEITELTFDFGSLTGGDSLSVEEELRMAGHPVIVRSVDGAYLIRMCAKACTRSIDFEIFEKMPAKDYIRITNISKRFF